MLIWDVLMKQYRTKYRKIGKIVEIRGIISPTVKIAAQESATIFQLAEGFRPNSTVYQVCHGSYANLWLLAIGDTGNVNLHRYASGNSYTETSTSAWLTFHVVFFIE